MLFFHILCNEAHLVVCSQEMQPWYYFGFVRAGMSMLLVAAFTKGYFSIQKKKGQVFSLPSVKYCSIFCWCTNQHKLSWVNRLLMISKNGNPWGFSLYPTNAWTPKVSLHLLQRWRMSCYRKEGALHSWGPGSAAGDCLVGSTCRWLELLKLLAPFTLPWRAGTHLGQSLSGHEKKRNN